MVVFPLTSGEKVVLFLLTAKIKEMAWMDPFIPPGFGCKEIGCWKGECGKEVPKPQVLLLAAVLKTHSLQTPQKAQERKLSLGMFPFSRQFFFLGYKNLFFSVA